MGDIRENSIRGKFNTTAYFTGDDDDRNSNQRKGAEYSFERFGLRLKDARRCAEDLTHTTDGVLSVSRLRPVCRIFYGKNM